MSESRGASRLVASVTASRLLFSMGIGALALFSIYQPSLKDESWVVICSLVLLGLAEASDALDGHFARKYGVVSDFGKMFDPYCDSVSRLIIYWSLAVMGRVWVVVPLVMAVRDVTVSYARIILTRKGRDVSARVTGKLKAVVQGVCAPILMALIWVDARFQAQIMGACSVAVIIITLASMFDYASAALADDEQGGAEGGGE